MPNCIIAVCRNRTSFPKDESGAILHNFPSSLERITFWLLQTGQNFVNVDSLAQRILDGRKTCLYRICSDHFTIDSYIINRDRRFLRPEAFPSIFPIVSEGEFLIDETLQRRPYPKRRRPPKLRATSHSKTNIEDVPLDELFISDNSTKRFRDVEVQTDESSFSNLWSPNIRPKEEDFEATVQDHTYFWKMSSQSSLELSRICELRPSDTFLHEDIPEEYSEEQVVQDRKFLVFESCLDSLILKVKCQGACRCDCTVKSFNKELQGSNVTIRGQCQAGHRFKIWESQPKIGNVYSGNVLLTASILCSGQSFRKVDEFLKILGLQSISKRTYYQCQHRYIFPAVDLAWKKQQKKVMETMKGAVIAISGDGRYYSLGPYARYCVYTMMNSVNDQIFDFEVVQKTKCRSPVAMEKYGFRRCMDRLLDSGFDVTMFSSDGHIGIQKILRVDYPRVNHQYDICHYARSLKKKMMRASGNHHCGDIIPWVEKIFSHFWWCIRTSQRSEELLKEKWTSVLRHITNCHSWEDGGRYLKCQHPEMMPSDKREVKWLKKDSPSYKALEKVVTSEKVLKDLPHLAYNMNMESLEKYQSKVPKYCSKRIHFGIDAMEARTKLAALSHNNNVGEHQITGTALQDTVGSQGTAHRVGKRWVADVVYDEVCNDHLEELLINVLKITNGTLKHNWTSRAPSLPPNISALEKPSKEEVMKHHVSRFHRRVSEWGIR
ncbi:uncharacterized protein LOC142750071 isoform X2 [Rhinoderma darwinii]